MNGPSRVVRAPDGRHLPPAGAAPHTVWFLDDSAAEETWAVGCPDPDAVGRAARAWAATAIAVSDAARAAAKGAPIRVPGEGVLARLVRLALADQAQSSGREASAVVVETTGTASGILDALAVARPGGCVLLGVRPLHSATALPTYRAVHHPGLRVRPVRWAQPVDGVPEPLVVSALAQLARTSPGQITTSVERHWSARADGRTECS
ncbi:hypothetical protein ACFCV8_05105 [Streptomyces sp. NPDC056347]|uniref:hypothetical protein n=1 Tax=Streptomyces sp. NPDC056347 TaxID=3345790 RepID=UPI0035D8F1EC